MASFASSLTVAQYRALGYTPAPGPHPVAILDTGAAIAAMTLDEFEMLVWQGIAVIDASDGFLSLTVEQYTALGVSVMSGGDGATISGPGGTVSLTASDAVTLADTRAVLSALTAARISELASRGIDRIDATDNLLNLTVAKYNALGTVTLTATDVVTLADTGANLAALTPLQIAALAAKGIDKLDATDNAVSLSMAQYQALGPVALTAADVVTLADAGAALAALSPAEIAALAAKGIDKLDATDNVLSLSLAQYQSLGALTLAAADVVTLADTGANLAGLSPAQVAALAGKGIDRLDATDNALAVTVAQLNALGTVMLTAADVVTLTDTGANLAALTAVEVAGLAGRGVDRIDAANNVLALTVAQYGALGPITLAAADTVSLADTGAALGGLTSAQIAALAGKGIDKLDATDNALSLSLEQHQALGAVTLTAADVVTLADTGAALSALTSVQIAALAGGGIDKLDATDNALLLTLAQYQALGVVTVTAADMVTLADTGAALAGLSAAKLAALAGKGIDRIDATDGALALTVAKYRALGTVALTAADAVTLADTGANLAALTAGQIAALAGAGVDRLDATNNALTLSVAQVDALGSVALTAGDVVTLADTGAALAAVSAAQIGALAGKGVDKIDATDNALTLTAAQYNVLGAVTLTAADMVTLVDTGAALASLTAVQFAALAAKGVDRLDAVDDALMLSVAQFTGLGAITLTAADVVTLADTGANLAALTTAQLSALAGKGIDRIDATDNMLVLTVAQYQALGTVALTTADAVTLADSGAKLAALTAVQMVALAGSGVDRLDATNDTLKLNVAQYLALGTVTLTAADVVTLADTGANLAALTAVQIAALAGSGIDKIDATDNVLSLSLAQYQALGVVTLAVADLVTLADSGANLAALTPAQIAALAGKGIDQLDATDNVLTLTIAQYNALSAVALALADVVTLADTGANLAALTAVQIAALAGKGIDRLDATDNALTLSLAQYQALGSVALVAGDLVTLADTGAALAALTPAQVLALAGKNVDRLDATDGVLALTVAQYLALGAVTLTAADVVTLADTGANLAGLTAAQVAALAGNGIDRIDATNNALALTVAQYTSLGAVTLTAADVVTLADTSSALAGLTAAQIAALAGKAVDGIDAKDNVLALTVAQYTSLGSVTVATADLVTLADTGASLGGLTAVQIAALAGKGVDRIDATDNLLSLTVAQYNVLGAVTLTAADVVTLADTGANLAALTAVQFTALAGNGIDKLDATDNTLRLTVAQYSALGSVTLATADTVTLADTGAALAGLTAVQFAALAGKGIDKIDATDDVLTLTVAQYNGLGVVTLTSSDAVTLADTGAALAALTSVQIAALAGKGIDQLDATNDALTLSVAQYLALGTVALTAGDVVTLADTGAALAALTTVQISALAGKGVDAIDANDNVLSLSVAQYQALGVVTLAAGDTVTLTDTGATLAALTPAQIAALAGRNVDRIDASNNVLTLTVAQLLALGAVLLTLADTVTLADTAANLDALTAAQIGALAGKGVDRIDATDNALSLSLADYQALGAVTLTAADSVTLTDTGAGLGALTPAQIAALAGAGIDAINASDDTLTLTVAQYRALGTVTLTGADYVILADTSANLATLTPAENAALASKGIDEVQATDNTTIETALASYTLDGTASNLTFIGTGPFEGTGNARDNVITGGASGDTLRGLVGNDTLIGGNGNDTLIGGLGADVLNGGAGSADWASYIDATAGVMASLANPSVNTGEAAGDTYIGIERLAGSQHDDTLIGDAGDNSLRGFGGADHLVGGAGRDTASYFTSSIGLTVSLENPALNTGEAAGDTYDSIENISGSAFDDVLTGNSSDNTLLGNGGADTLNGGVGYDYASYDNATAGVTASLANPSINTGEAAGDTYISIEALSGSAFDDVLTGNSGDNWLQGQAGADQLDGGGGFDYTSYYNATAAVIASLANPAANTGDAAGDTYISIEGLSGSAYNDVLTGNASDNWMIGQGGADQLNGGGGFDFVSYSGSSIGITASIADQSVNTGEAAGDVYNSIEGIGGSAFNDILIGDANNNNLRGQGGADQLDGGGGFDYASYNNAPSGVAASLDTSLPISNTGEAAGDTYISIEGLMGSNFADILVGNAGANFLIGYSGGDIFFGGAGNDTFYGSSQSSNTDGASDRVDYSQVTGLSQGIMVNWLAGSVVGQAGIIDTDSMFGIEAIYGTAFADTFDATDYSGSSARAGDFNGYQLVRGGGGNDTIIGNNNTEALHSDATGGVTVTLSIVAGVYGGTATGAGVGTDQLTNVYRFVGSLHNDVYWGTGNAEIFDGFEGGEDVFHGGANFDTVEYDGGNRQAIDVNMAAGTVTGRAPGSNIGSDTLDSIERIRGSEFADRYNAVGFSGSSINAGSSGTSNMFEGQGGADEVTGNGNTSLVYFNASGSVFVTMTGQGAGTATATYGSNTATDTFTGVFQVMGSNSNDSFIGGTGNDNFMGQNGNDVLQGNAGNDTLEGGAGADALDGGADFDIASYASAGAGVTASLANPGSNTGDAAGDTYASIEGLTGSNFNDTLTGDAGNNTLNGGFGMDILIGGGGADVLDGGLDGGFASYVTAATAIVASLANPAGNTGDAAGDTYISILGLIGSNFNDQLTGSTLNDTLEGGFGNDTQNGGDGSDQATYERATGGISVNMSTGVVTGAAGTDSLYSIEQIRGSDFADVYDASAYTASTLGNSTGGVNLFEGGGGADTIIGNGSTVLYCLSATAGISVTMTGASSGTVLATYGSDTATDTFSGVSSIQSTRFNDVFNGSTATDSFSGGDGDDVIYGGDGDDTLLGGLGSDHLYGGAGDDLLVGDAGIDLLDGGSGIDTAFYAMAVTIWLGNSSMNGGGAAGDTLISIENLGGSSLADVLIGDANDNFLSGNNGDDVLNGGAGKDNLQGGEGNDNLNGGGVTNAFSVVDMDTLWGGNGNDTFVFNTALGGGNIAWIGDFAHGADKIELDHAIFAALATGQLDDSAFRIGTAAADATDRIIYDSGTRNLMYDADGAGGQAAVVFAVLNFGTTLDHTDFLIK